MKKSRFFRSNFELLSHIDDEGCEPLVETNPDLVGEARRLRPANPVTGKRKSYQRVANELFELGFMTANGTPFKREFVHKLLG